MQQEHWRQLKAIFQSAIELPLSARDAYIAKACGDDSSLRQEVRSLVFSHHEAAGNTIEEVVAGAANRVIQKPDAGLLVGRRLGAYQVLGHIGQGGMADVYLAVDTRLARRVALKLLLPEFTADRDRLRRFRQEAQLVSALNHPNIVTIHEVRQAGSLHFIVTELVEGRTLRQVLLDGALEIGYVLKIAVQIAAALEAAHRAGVVHRDVKPENIMLRTDGYIKVLDFGIAKPNEKASLTTKAGSGSLPGILIGTVSYMSPEQVRGLDVDHRTDIFSFGVLLYEMIAGRRPFDGPTASDTIANLLTKQPEPLARINPRLPVELERIVGTCLEKDLSGRCQSVQELTRRLTDLARELDSDVKTADRRNRANRQKRRQSPRRRVGILLSVIMVAALVFGLSLWRTSGYAGSEVRSVAVLPLVDSSGSSENSHFADGLTRMLIASLARMTELRVIGPTSVMRLRNTKKSLPEIAEQLRVDALVQGKVLRSGNRVRIAAKFIDARSGRQLWANSYEQDVRDISAMQQRVARDVASEIRIELTPTERSYLTNAKPVKPAAFDAYLKGQSDLNRRNEASLRSAIGYFREALNEDPSYALPYVGVAEATFALGTVLVGAIRPRDALVEAEAASTRALVLDDSLPEAQTIQAVTSLYNWKWEEADRRFRKVIDFHPNYAPAHTWYAVYQSARGRLGEAIARTSRAADLDPLSPHICQNLGWHLHYARRFDEAIEQYRKTFQLDPEFRFARDRLAAAYLEKGMVLEAVAECERMADERHRDPAALSELGYAYAKAGRRAEAREILEELTRMARWRYVNPYAFARVHIGLGEKDGAFEWLERCCRDRSYIMVFLKVDPALDPLRSDPRFQSLLHRIGDP